jgi:hypothetical protein
MSNKALYKMYIDCGRMGELESVFIAEKNEIEALIGKEVYFGEVLGKHSDIYGELEEHEITLITDDVKVIEIVDKYGLETGLNPLDYYTCPDCGNILDPITDKCNCYG